MEPNYFDSSRPLSIYGFGNNGRKLARALRSAGVKLQYFIDQRAEANQLIDGLPCLKPTELDSSVEQVVLGVFNRDVSPRSLESLLLSKGVRSVIGYTQINNFIPGVVRPIFWYDSALDLSNFKDEISKIKNIFHEKTSSDVLSQILEFRSLGNPTDHPEGIGLESQYFNVDVPGWLTGNELVMLDCGAFDGDSILSAVENKAPISKAFCFEPDLKNFSALTKTCAAQSKIACFAIPCATWSSTTTLYFSESEGESSRVMENTSIPVQAIAIDDFVAGSTYEFIKIDVEGADLDTLKGAIRSLKSNRPYIAIGIYHRPKDLWEIPLFLNDHLDQYSFYLRQHGHHCLETVLYCVPS